MDELRSAVMKAARYMKEGLWLVRPEDQSRLRAAVTRLLRTAVLSVRGFAEDNCQLRASALTFYSLLSIVPVAAMAFGIAKGFGFEKRLERQLMEQIPGQEEVLLEVVASAYRFLENTQGGLIAGIGVVVLFWSVIKVLSHIENAFNRIWQIDKSRTFGRKFADYLSIMLIGPVLVIVSSSANVFITTQITHITQKVALLGMVSTLIFSLLKLVPYCLVWILFTLVYMIMPNTRVRFGPGLLGSVIAGTAYHFAQWGYISFQVGVARYNAIYGSFAALPLFLIWLQASWLIVLFGAEISYAAQNHHAYDGTGEGAGLSARSKGLLCLVAAHHVVKKFTAGRPAPTLPEIAGELAMPDRLARRLVEELVAAGVLARISPADGGEPAFQPAVDPDRLTLQWVLSRLSAVGMAEGSTVRPPAYAPLKAAMQRFEEIVETSAANRRLKEI